MSLPPEYPTSPAPLPPKKTNWVLIGCGGCLGLIVLGCIGFGALFYVGVKSIKNSGPYLQALQSAQNTPAVQEELGVPITPAGFMPTGSVHVTNDTGDADINFAISGPKGKGNVSCKAAKAGGVWQIQEENVTVQGSGKVIPITGGGDAPASGGAGITPSTPESAAEAPSSPAAPSAPAASAPAAATAPDSSSPESPADAARGVSKQAH